MEKIPLLQIEIYFSMNHADWQEQTRKKAIL